MTTPLLWINKDRHSKVLSRSDKDGTRLIFRHVQRYPVRPRRKRKLKALAADLSSVAQSSRLALSNEREEAAEDIDALRNVGKRYTPTHLLSTNFRKGDSFDPFDCFPVRIDQSINSVLNFYMRSPVITDNNPKSIANRDLTQGLSSALPVSIIVRGSMSNGLHLYALLTATSVRMMEASPSTPQPVDVYMLKAVQHLRTFLQSCNEQTVIEPQNILNVVLLALAEIYRHDYQAVLAHLDILRHLIKNLDMSRHFDGFIYELITNIDIIVSNEKCTKPRFPILWESGKSTYLTDLIEPRIRSKLLRHRDRTLSVLCFDSRLAEYAVFQHQILKVLPEALQMDSFYNEGQAVAPDLVYLIHVTCDRRLPCEAAKVGTVWVAKSAYAVLHQLLSNPTPRQRTAWLTFQQEECCRLASMIIITYLVQNLGLGFPRSVSLNMCRLRNLLSGDDLSWGSAIGDRLLLWVLATGHFAALGTPEADWFSANARTVAMRLNFHGYEELFRSFMVCLRRVATPPYLQSP